MAVGIVRTQWAGTSGGPGLTQLAIREGAGAFWTATQAQNAVNAVRAFWDSAKAYLPDNVTLTVSPVVDIYQETDAVLTASVIAPTPPLSVAGTSAGVFSMAAGIKMNLNTGIIRNGRRVRGSMFLVPAAITAYNNDGAVTAGTRTALNTSGATLVSSLSASGLELSVWSRPVVGVNARPGALSLVSLVETNEKSAILRGRRD